MYRFERGKEYGSLDAGIEPIKVIDRTSKMIRVRNSTFQWMMLIRVDENGNEYVIDSATPRRWREAFTYKAEFEIKEEKNDYC